MIKKISLLSIVFYSLNFFAQNNLKTGYVVLETNDTIVGTLNNKNYYSKSSVKVFQENNTRRFSKRELSEIHVENNAYVKSDLGIWSQAFFKKELFGNINLYTFRKAKVLGGFDTDIGSGKLSSAIKFYCSDYPNVLDAVKVIDKENVADFIQMYNDWKLINPDSKSFFEENIHTKPLLNFKLSFLLPGAGIEFGLNNNLTINSMLKNEFGYSSTAGWFINPFIETQLRYYLNMNRRKAENKRTYKYSGNYICLVDGYFLDDNTNFIGLEYGWQRTVSKHWYYNLGVGAGKYTTENQDFVFLFDFDFGYNF